MWKVPRIFLGSLSRIARCQNWFNLLIFGFCCSPIHPWTLTWNLKSPNWKGKSSEPNLHDFGFQPFIFQGLTGGCSTLQSRCLVRFAERFQLSEQLLAQLMAAVLRQLSKARAEMERGGEIFPGKKLWLSFLNPSVDFGFCPKNNPIVKMTSKRNEHTIHWFGPPDFEVYPYNETWWEVT